MKRECSEKEGWQGVRKKWREREVECVNEGRRVFEVERRSECGKTEGKGGLWER